MGPGRPPPQPPERRWPGSALGPRSWRWSRSGRGAGAPGTGGSGEGPLSDLKRSAGPGEVSPKLCRRRAGRFRPERGGGGGRERAQLRVDLAAAADTPSFLFPPLGPPSSPVPAPEPPGKGGRCCGSAGLTAWESGTESWLLHKGDPGTAAAFRPDVSFPPLSPPVPPGDAGWARKRLGTLGGSGERSRRTWPRGSHCASGRMCVDGQLSL